MSYRVVIPYTYENLGNMNYDSSSLNVPYEQFGYKIEQFSEQRETLGFSDNKKAEVSLKRKEKAIPLSSKFKGILKRSFFEEGIWLSDSDKKSITATAKETITLNRESKMHINVKKHLYFNVFDTKVVANNGSQVIETNGEYDPITVLSDLEYASAEEGLKEFATYCNRKSPLGYSPLRPLYAGDYEYQDAIVGVQVSLTPPVDGRYGIVGSTLHIDVEDVIDRGEVRLSAEWNYVPFNKKYYTKPRILTHVSNADESCQVVIEQVDLRNNVFKVCLRSTIDGKMVSGTLTWLAEGY